MNLDDNVLQDGLVDGSEILDATMPLMDFETEAVAQLLIPTGKYKGTITGSTYNPKITAIVLQVTLNENDERFASDNTTPVDNLTVDYLGWMPKPGDETAMAKTKQKMTKRQQKITNLKEMFNSLGVEILNTSDIQTKILSDCLLIGKDVMVDISVDSYKGKMNNRVNNIKLFEIPSLG